MDHSSDEDAMIIIMKLIIVEIVRVARTATVQAVGIDGQALRSPGQ